MQRERLFNNSGSAKPGITVISGDFDGTFDIFSEELSNVWKSYIPGMLSPDSEPVDGNVIVEEEKQAFLKYLKDNVVQDGSEVIMYVGSNRQSKDIDTAIDATHKRENNYSSGSCFDVIASLCEEKGWNFMALLLADTLKNAEIGTAIQSAQIIIPSPREIVRTNDYSNHPHLDQKRIRILREQLKYMTPEKETRYSMSPSFVEAPWTLANAIWNDMSGSMYIDKEKIATLLNQIWHVASLYPEEPINFCFIDDDPNRSKPVGGDIHLNNLKTFFEDHRDLIPENVRIHIIRYSWQENLIKTLAEKHKGNVYTDGFDTKEPVKRVTDRDGIGCDLVRSPMLDGEEIHSRESGERQFPDDEEILSLLS